MTQVLIVKTQEAVSLQEIGRANLDLIAITADHAQEQWWARARNAKGLVAVFPPTRYDYKATSEYEIYFEGQVLVQ